MTIRYAPDRPLASLWICDLCGREMEYLSESWSQITITVTPATQIRHHCLECRSDKKEWREPAQ